MSLPINYKFSLLSMKSHYRGSFEEFQAEAERQRADLKSRIANGGIVVNESVRVDPVETRTLAPSDPFLAVFEVSNEFSYKTVTIDDAHLIKNELLKNPLWFETNDGSPIVIGR
ncbi:hypothetical protein V0242_11720 [Aeromonas hydrophila]|uniref:hypothetical protein n=1 Tax=Aeromonas hydrophila TaxID=644 RepID=UPI002ED475D2|nr:hypothetical protein V0242_11720 [Aeromonas hydrophila]